MSASFVPLLWAMSLGAETGLTSTTKSILMALANHCGDARGGSCYPSHQTIAKETLFSERTVGTGIRDLAERSFLTILSKGNGRGQSARYILHVDMTFIARRGEAPDEEVLREEERIAKVEADAGKGATGVRKGATDDIKVETVADKPPLNHPITTQPTIMSLATARSTDSAGEKNLIQGAVEIWNEVCAPTLPMVKKLTDVRRRTLRARLREHFQDDLAEWHSYCASLVESDFLSGRSTDFMATFDWATGPKNIVKVLEGNYQNRAPEPRAVASKSRESSGDPADLYGADAWIKTVPDTHLADVHGKMVPCILGIDAAGTAVDVCTAAGFDPSDRPELTPIAQWLREGIAYDLIMEAVRGGRRPDRPVLRYFDPRIRELLARKAA